MGKIFTIGVIVAIIVVLVLIFGFGGDTTSDEGVDSEDNNEVLPPSEENVPPEIVTPQTYNVVMSSSGFSPSTLAISLGDTVVFLAEDSSNRWPASAVHPTHNVYPEGGGCIGSVFDSCGGIVEGESYTFTFDEAGTWGYHDHLSPGSTGKIVVIA